MPFELRKSFNFEASHVLSGHNGKCARLHGHSYVLTLVLRGARLQSHGPQRNMLADFCDISAAAKGVIASHLDHHHLNDTLKTDSPTAEFIARWAYRALAPALGPRLVEVELRETATAVVTYRPSRATARRHTESWVATHSAAAEAVLQHGYESDSTSTASDGLVDANCGLPKGNISTIGNGCRLPPEDSVASLNLANGDGHAEDGIVSNGR
jgi:6-pyruvoyltetrahydropterin/6-carboxytetrahydropterin synthase